MDRALMFHRNTDVSKENIRTADPVSTSTDYHVLYQAASYNLLRCVYANCLEPLKPVREEGSLTRVSHFAHRSATYESPYCPYRAISCGDTSSSSGGGKSPHNIRKLIESRLYEELLRKFPQARISISDDHKREPRIQIDGLSRPLLILSIAPHDEALWKEPFDGTVEGRQVLFFIASGDIPKLRSKEINQKLLAKSSAIIVFSDIEDGQDFTFKIAGEISPTNQASGDPLDQLDLIYVNYQTLFDLNREPEYLFIKSQDKGPIEFMLQQLKSAASPLTRKLIQLLAKRLLVDSTRVHQIVFEQTYSESKEFFRECKTFPQKHQLIDLQEAMQLQRETTTAALLKEPSVQPLYKEFFLQAIEVPIKKLQEEKKALQDESEAKRRQMQGTIDKLEAEKRAQTAQFETERKLMQDSINKLTLQLEQKRKEHESENYRWQQLDAEAEKLKNQIAEIQKSKAALRDQLHTRNRELDNEQKRREKLSDAIETLRQNPFARVFLNYYDIQQN